MSMVEFDLLEVTSFMAIGVAQVNLKQRGLVFIEGENLDDTSARSNGAGKSSLVDAISWCLYGITARGVSGDAVVNRQAGKGTEVAMNVWIDGKLWRIERGRKHKTLKNRVRLLQMDGGTWHDCTLGTDKLTQERIDALLGCNAKTFNDAVYMGQERMVDLPSMTDKVLKSTLEQALSLDRLDEAQSIASMRLENANIAHRQHRYDMDDLVQKVVSNTDKLKAAETTKIQLEFDMTNIEEERQRFHKDNLHTVSIAAKEEEAATLEVAQCISAVRDAELEVAKVKEEIKLVATESKKLLANTDKLLDVLTDLRASRKILHDHINNPSSCTTCKRPFDDHEDIEAKRAEHQKEYAALGVKLEKVVQKRAELADKNTTMVTAATRAELMAVSALESAQSKVKAAETRLSNAKEILTKARTSDRLLTLDRWLKEKQDRHDQIVRDMLVIGEVIADATGEVKEIEARLTESQERIDTLERVKHILSRKGFRGEVLDQVTPYLNARTQYYLTWLTSDNITATWNTVTVTSSGDLSENFHIKVAHREGAESFEGLSGGEKRKVRLACAMALQDLVGTRAIKPIKLFIADEIDDAIDESGLELLMGLLEEKAKSVGTLLIISHNALGDWCKESITVTKKDGETTIK